MGIPPALLFLLRIVLAIWILVVQYEIQVMKEYLTVGESLPQGRRHKLIIQDQIVSLKKNIYIYKHISID